MREICNKALEIFKGREEALKKIEDYTIKDIEDNNKNVEDYVSSILDIFNASNCEEELCVLVWKVRLERKNKMLEVKVSFSYNEQTTDTEFVDESCLEPQSSFVAFRCNERVKKAMQELNELEIQANMILPIHKYFRQNLKEYFEVKSNPNYIIIEMKKPSICEREEFEE